MQPTFLDRLKALLAQAARRAAGAFRTGLRFLGMILRRVLEVLLALVVLFEEWGWRPLAALLARLGRWRPWAMLEGVIADLPPYLALGVFALPTLLFLPLKLAAFYLIAKGQAVAASALFIAAKVFGTALVARLFQLTQPALMRIPWFAWAYERFMPWKEAVFANIRATWAWRYGRIVKARVKRLAEPMWKAAKSRLAAVADELRQRARAWFSQSGP
jgi:hypothetical protein